MKFKISTVVLASLVIATAFTSCKDDKKNEFVLNRPDLEIQILSFNNQLTAFNSSNISTPLRASVSITGMQAPAGNNPAEVMLAIDYRPATGQLYGITNYSRLFIINPASGATNLIGTTSPLVSGNIAAFDFNPTVDRIRVITSTGQNLRVNPETAAATTDGVINGGASPLISGSAYSNNVPSSTSTTLYNIDVVSQKLYRQDPPNDGTLVEIGSLNLPASSGNSGFDISDKGIALAVIRNGANSALYQIDLEKGTARTLGSIANSSTSTSSPIGMAIVPQPVAYAVDVNNNLMTFNPAFPNIAPVSKAIMGLQAGENVLGIDFRPLNGQLYALGSNSNIYTVNTATAVATRVNALPLTPALSGTNFGFDINPQEDFIRITSNTGQNLRVNPVTGVVTVSEPSITPGSPSATAAAYSNNIARATSTTLFVIDAAADKLFTQNPTTGVLTSVGNASVRLGINISDNNGFDISGGSGTAYGIFSVNTTVNNVTSTAVRLYLVNTTTGVASVIADFPSQVRGFALGLGF